MKSFKFIIVALVAMYACTGLSLAQNSTSTIGQIKAFIVQGDVQSRVGRLGTLTPVSRGDLIAVGTTIETGADGSALIVFSNGSAMQIKANSRVQVEAYSQTAFDEKGGDNTFLRLQGDPSKSTTQLKIDKGTLVGQVKKLDLDADSSFTVDTPAGSAGIRGTIPVFTVTTDPITGKPTGVTMSCSEGSIVFHPTPLAGVPIALQNGPVQIDAGGQAEVTIQTNGTVGTNGAPTVTSITIAGTTYTGADAQSVIDSLYAAINEVIVAQGGTAVAVPVTAPANPPQNTGNGPQSTPKQNNTPAPPNNPTVISA
jgi:hypothetical protein